MAASRPFLDGRSQASLAILALLVAGCGPRVPLLLGQAPAGDAVTVDSVRTARHGTPVVVAGEMIEKCPVAGCWFVMRDGTGTLRVDTKNAGFVVLDVPLHRRITVTGLVKTTDGETQLEAAGVRY